MRNSRNIHVLTKKTEDIYDVLIPRIRGLMCIFRLDQISRVTQGSKLLECDMPI